MPKIQEAEKYSEITFAEAEGQVQQIVQRGAGEGSKEQGRRIIQNAWERVQSFLTPVQEKLESVWGFVQERIDQLWGIVEAQAERLYGVLAEQMDAALSRFEQMAVRVNLRIIRKIDQGMAMAAEVWGRVRAQLQIAFAQLSIALSGLLAGLLGRVNSVVGALRARVSEMINRLRSGINTAVNRLTGLAQSILSVFGNRVQGVLSRFRAGATGAVNSAANAAQSAWSRLSARGMAAWQSLQVTGASLITLPLTMGMNTLMMAISRGDRLIHKAQNAWSQVRAMWLNGITATRNSFIMIREGARAVVSSIRGRSFTPIFGWLRSRFGALEKRVQRLLSRAEDTYQNLLRWAEEAAQMGGIGEPGFAVPAGTESREAGAREHLPAAVEGHAPEGGRGRGESPEQAGEETVLKPPKPEEEIKPENLAQEKPPKPEKIPELPGTKPEAAHISEKPKGEEPTGANLTGAIAGTSADQIVTQETKKPAGNETAEKVKTPEPTGVPMVDQIVAQETKKPAGNETADKVKAPEPAGAPVVDQIVAQETKKPAGNETADKVKVPEPAGVTAAEQIVTQDAEKPAGKAPGEMEKAPAPIEMKEPNIMIPKSDLWEREKEKLGDER